MSLVVFPTEVESNALTTLEQRNLKSSKLSAITAGSEEFPLHV
jgi:hypothetical protein